MSHPNSRRARIVQADADLQETRGQRKEGDEDARPPVLSANSPAGATTQSQRSRPGS